MYKASFSRSPSFFSPLLFKIVASIVLGANQIYCTVIFVDYCFSNEPVHLKIPFLEVYHLEGLKFWIGVGLTRLPCDHFSTSCQSGQLVATMDNAQCTLLCTSQPRHLSGFPNSSRRQSLTAVSKRESV